tara:strand:- start:4489 stop:4698 length:210 start_codon:yes stop_codon:yes gene_type:complete
MGEAKRRKELGLPPREKPIELPKLDKESIQKNVRSTLYKYPIIPFVFYGAAILSLVGGVFYVVKFYKLV